MFGKYNENYKKYYDMKARNKSQFKSGDMVVIRENNMWVPGVVTK